ncbi:MAG: GNAT family N-acetyltransferase [Candidatus Limnocylindria bacterium]
MAKQPQSAVTDLGVSGLVIRPYAGADDVPAFVRIINAEYAADGVDERLTEEGERAWLAESSVQFDPARDVSIAELDGRPVAVATRQWVDLRDGSAREFRVWGAVDPAFRERGIGRALLAENERRSAELASAQELGRPAVLAAFYAEGRPGGRLMRHAGYEIVRWFFDMVRPSLDGLPSERPSLPDGLELRPAMPDHYPAIWRANREAFRDHWGGSDESEAAMRRFLESPEMDPSLWLIAWDAEEVAAGVINAIYDAQNEALGLRRGWLDSVFTRRPWRNRGLARALIVRSLVLLRERGMTSAALGVDADNPTGALGLYERAGFGVHDRFVAWRKAMNLGDVT